MRYLPHTPEDIAVMLDTIGIDRLEDLFQMIPAAGRRTEPLDLPEPLTEWAVSYTHLRAHET